MKNIATIIGDMRTLKFIVSLLLSASAFCLSSCEQADLVNDNLDNGDVTFVSKDQLKMKFGSAFAKVLAEDKEAREIVKEEALKQIDYDYDVLYLMIKDRKNKMGNTLEQLLLKYIPQDSLSIIVDMIPNLTIFVPELPENTFSAETWNISNMIPKVAVRLTSSSEIPIWSVLGKERILAPNEIPAFPVVVIKENERIIASSSSNTRQVLDNRLNGLAFLDSSFDNLSTNDKMIVTRSTYERYHQGSSTMDPRFTKVKEAYEKVPKGTGWQRDYIYYNISSSNPNGPFQYQCKEFLWGFEMNGDVVGAINKISDQAGDPQYYGNVTGIIMGKIRVVGSGWVDGEFEFKVKVYVASKTAVGNEFVTYFRIKATDLFDITAARNGDVYTVYSAKNKRVLFADPIPLFSWNLDNYSSTIKIALEEVDNTETIVQTSSTTSEFATNFGFDATFGEVVKLGGKFGASAKVNKTVTYQVSTTKGNDELGEVIINFGDDILVDDTSMGTPLNGKYFYLNMSPQYYTGWYRLFISPGSIN
ncbi:hypothetical protein [Bacteroides sp.]|uniref:hypothetical protein n=1 Tax=Bacteroides sp. TaxID=29523 RepID=UPI004024CADA